MVGCGAVFMWCSGAVVQWRNKERTGMDEYLDSVGWAVAGPRVCAVLRGAVRRGAVRHGAVQRGAVEETQNSDGGVPGREFEGGVVG